MRGYLQRLASTVSAPRGREGLHPFVGSLSTPSHWEEQHESVIAAPRSTAGREREEQPAGTPHSTETAREINVQADPIEVEHSHQHLLQPAPTPTKIAPVVEQPHLVDRVTRQRAAEQQHEKQQAGHHLTPLFEPLMHEEVTQSDAAEAPSAISQARAQRTNQPQASVSLSKPEGRVDGPRESRPAAEDIQIHIGRIEVIAIPSAASSKPATTRVDRSLSLDEYLRRRNGSAR
jgi:hypothetical protein